MELDRVITVPDCAGIYVYDLIESTASVGRLSIPAGTVMRNWSWEMIKGFEALHAGRGRRNPVWSGKEAHWSLRGLIVKSAEHCGADYKVLDK